MTTNEQLQAQLDQVREELAALRRQLPGRREAESAPRLLSRRNLLRAAPVAAVGAAVATLVADPAAAADGDAVLQGRTNAAGGGVSTGLSGGTPGTGVDFDSTPALAVEGGVVSDWFSADGVSIGVATNANLEVLGFEGNAALAASFIGRVSTSGRAASGSDAVHITALGPGTALTVDAGDGGGPDGNGGQESEAGTGLRCTAQTGDAMVASSSSGHALVATNDFGAAVAVTSGTGPALTAATTSTDAAGPAVSIEYAGAGRALYARSDNQQNTFGTVTGINEGQGTGVWGEQRNDVRNGFGVVGIGGKLGRGAQFSGGRAAVRLMPSAAATHPSTGRVGDLFVDASARLWFCQKPSTGTVRATWKQIA